MTDSDDLEQQEQLLRDVADVLGAIRGAPPDTEVTYEIGGDSASIRVELGPSASDAGTNEAPESDGSDDGTPGRPRFE